MTDSRHFLNLGIKRDDSETLFSDSRALYTSGRQLSVYSSIGNRPLASLKLQSR
jgi:hypothetical protein